MSIARPLRIGNPLGDLRRSASDLIADDARLIRLGRRMALAAVLLLVLFATYYGYDRYFVQVPSPLDQAARKLEDQVRQSPNDADLRMQMGGTYAQQGRYDQAVAQYEEVLKVREDWTPALLALATVEQARGNDARAETLYRQVADQFKDSDFRYGSKDLQVVYFRLGVYAARAGRNDEAASWAQEALKVDETDSDALYLLGTSQETLGQLDDARDDLRKAVSFDPSFRDAWTALGRVSTAQGDQVWAVYSRGMEQYASGDAETAQATFQQLISASPDFAPAYEGLGLAYAKQNDADDAKKAFRAALARDPGLLLSQWSLNSLGGDK